MIHHSLTQLHGHSRSPSLSTLFLCRSCLLGVRQLRPIDVRRAPQSEPQNPGKTAPIIRYLESIIQFRFRCAQTRRAGSMFEQDPRHDNISLRTNVGAVANYGCKSRSGRGRYRPTGASARGPGADDPSHDGIVYV